MTNCAALRADAAESAVCDYLSLVALVGIGLNAIWRIGWIEATAALIIVPLIVRQGFQSTQWRRRQGKYFLLRLCVEDVTAESHGGAIEAG